MTSAQRRYPRISFDRPGHMEVRPPGDAGAEPIRVPVRIKSLSPEGVGVVVADARHASFRRGAHVTMFMTTESADLEIPGRIAWTGSQQSTTPYNYGIRFQLALAPGVIRQAWARWVVAQIQSAS